MTIREAARAACARLALAGIDTAAYESAQMLAHLLGENALMMRMNDGRELAPEAADAYEKMIARRERREPMQYILGSCGFMGLEFHVEPGVLCPRPDTEILCEEALSHVRPGSRVLDIGTGSGALAVSIARHAAGCCVTAVDVSETALRVAGGNAQANGADVRFVKSDCFEALAGEVFDVIVSNPPYISREEMDTLMPEVKQEPELALFGGEDGLDFYRRIASQAPAYLAPEGVLLFEIGWRQKDDVSALLEKHIGTPHALRDYGGNWRVVYAKKEK
ncbi:MAG: peptide chain release factor N(5)-glutamine methyltransferase [Clostridia bacterium]|nr:peptide chain release factor N(5)-glutamine methyltransferase [Clostridia bacterium]